ncbi:hypothetical protein [Streptomyces sp. IBSBF 2435]|uniref:hypothetical protein n=1 Tax=Streptomyces sp. IBSBF 2435 TaxID=2903531 RepID=UPI002FDC4137
MADNATLQSQYLAQVEADLERTTKEKTRIAAELAALQEQLTVLEQDHALLVGVRQTLVGATPATAQGAGPVGVPADAPTVPRARTPKPAARTRKSSAAEKPAAKSATAASGSSGTPTLVKLVAADLTEHGEPRSAAEITTSLTRAHPGRKIQPTAVRNTLEALVAKGQSLRSKQGRSVYYSPAATAPAPAAAADETAAATA